MKEPLSDDEIAAIDEAGKKGPPTMTWQMLKNVAWRERTVAALPQLFGAVAATAVVMLLLPRL